MTDDPHPTDRTDTRDDAELRATRAAQQAHGGSMAPGLVDETGHQIAETPDERVAGTVDPVGGETDR